jgi:predicted metal-binding membrane protein
LAGVYQVTPLKDICLRHCRTPLSFVMTRWRDGRGGAVRMGLLHGLYCMGCCWLLFLILIPLGVMNVAAMVAVCRLFALEWGVTGS